MRRYIVHGAFFAGAETALRVSVTLSLNLTRGSGFAATGVSRESGGTETVEGGEGVGVGVVSGVGT
ncbi:hypothetical protein RRF57_005079 [Xylaria bambusicola]|uniref:Uncharacterized protein n=1 Tax=Xylaria bambusicola TaxID=326684 RepID=A0AAN7UBR9_9PEZI